MARRPEQSYLVLVRPTSCCGHAGCVSGSAASDEVLWFVHADTRSDKGREVRGQGIANLVAGAFGGMAGCAMIGQTMVNMKSGGRTRLSTLASGVFLLILVLVLDDVVALIPMAALVAVMIFVSISTFNWRSISLSAWRDRPKSQSLVVVAVAEEGGQAFIATARDMTDAEKKTFRRKAR